MHLVSIASSWRQETGSKDEDPHAVCDMEQVTSILCVSIFSSISGDKSKYTQYSHEEGEMRKSTWSA